MKRKFQLLARKNGQEAIIKARRVAVILNLKPSSEYGQRWLLNEALRVSKVVEYHLRQANLIGQLIERMDEEIRIKNNYPDRTFIV
jgi:hypothetical protein